MARTKTKKTRAENLVVGKDFLAFLKEKYQKNSFERTEMVWIFRYSFSPGRVPGEGYKFSQILYALRNKHKVRVDENGQIQLTTSFVAKDQYTTLKKHALDLQADAPASLSLSRRTYYCSDCSIQGNSLTSFQGHLSGRKHFKQMSLKYLKTRRTELMEDKNGIQVTSNYDGEDGVIETCMDMENEQDEDLPVKISITVKNTSRSDIRFLACVLLKAQPAFTFSDERKEVNLKPVEECNIEVLVSSQCIGILQSPLLLAFSPVDDKTVFHILRFLKVEVRSDIAKDLPPAGAPYQRPARVSRRQPKGEVVEGEPPLMSNKSKLKMGVLGTYFVPDPLRNQINSKYKMDKVKNNIQALLSWDNYAQKMSDLLHIEECQMEVDIRRYDMHGATMRKDYKFLRLKVPGLAENRPSVLRGDHLFAIRTNDRSNPNPKKYKGYVHRVEMEEVVLGFSRDFVEAYITGLQVDIEFTFSRRPLRLQHFAVEEAAKHADLQKVLFPRTTDIGRKGALTSIKMSEEIKLYDRNLNQEQNNAIQHILQGSSRPAPYLVFGPPGTGKTVTIVESIKQVFCCLPASRILACAPSNSAADLIAKRLLTGTGTPIAKTTLFRINALSRDWKTVDQAVKVCCNYDVMTEETFFPSKEDLMEKRVIVTTLCTAGRLATAADFPYDHFTHVFIDEAGHAVEPEAIISLSNLLNPNNPRGGQVVLAGDPKQLGPILRSPLALEHGLELSLLERLMTKCEMYEHKEEEPHYDSRVLTKLLRNYRSHPAILKLPNQMFYANELEPHANELVRESLCRWEELPNKSFPIIFHGVEGVDEREGHSPSFFNKKEIEIVVKYTEDLREKRGKPVQEAEIGIISPYRRQVQKIKEVLKKRHHGDIKVGSVEEFQGQERLVIIVSTVRSTKPEHIQMDVDYKLGFLKNPKRFNVAVTRAKALLIIVGNPYTLRKDDNWSRFLKYCVDNNAYKGCRYVEDEEELDETMQKLEKLKITPDLVDKPANDVLGVSAFTEQQDPEWRSENS